MYARRGVSGSADRCVALARAARRETNVPGNTDKVAKPTGLKVLVAEDRLTAWVQVQGVGRPDFAVPTEDEVVAAAQAARLAVTDDVRTRAKELVGVIREACAAGAESAVARLPERFVIAQGQLPVEGEDGRVELVPELAQATAPADEEGQVDYFAASAIVTVAAGAKIGRLVPERAGTPGVDVLGRPRAPRKPQGNPVKLGAGVKCDPADEGALLAVTAGRLELDGGRVRISEVLAVPGDVDFSTGSIESCVNVHIAGTVRAKFKVKTTASLAVDRVIEAAEVDVGGDVLVRGGIFGAERTGHVRAGGSVTAKLLNEVVLEAGGDVRFGKEILNACVRTRGHLIGERGTVIGGDVYAREGLRVLVLGSEGCVLTLVGTGVDVNALRRGRQLERQIKELHKSAEQIRQAIQPLMANMKRLLPAQRERATELLCKADEIDLQVDELKKQMEQLQTESKPQGTPSILVGEMIHPGVRLVIDAREARVQKALHGPVRIEMRKIDDVTQMAAVNQRTGSVTVLPCVDVDLDAPPADAHPATAPNPKPSETQHAAQP